MPSTVLGEHATTIPAGTTAQRPTGVQGMVRYNTSTESLEMFDGANWTIVKSVFTATGGTITDAGEYRIHTFTSSGSFIVSKGTNTADILMAAGGGGGGGASRGGAGGAGGLVVSAGITITPQTYTVTVGSGGPAGAYNSNTNADVRGTSGQNSSFPGVTTAVGGGYGGASDGGPANAGGSGGSGGSGWYNGARGTGTPGQGNNSGLTSTGAPYGAGGGGAGSIGNDPPNMSGGNGLAYSYSGTSTYYSGGGGGSNFQSTGASGGLGGGGTGNNAASTPGQAPQNGTANTGGGGGAAGNGGSGIIIIRYPK